MKMSRYIMFILVQILALPLFAQTEYNPTNPPDPSPVYKLKVTANPVEGGTVTGGGYYKSGTTVTVKAEENLGYEFAGWADAVDPATIVSTNKSYSYRTDDKPHELVAKFNVNPSYTITVAPQNNEYGRVNTSGGIYHQGDVINLTAYANANYTFREWKVNGVSAAASSSFAYTVGETNAEIIACYDFTPNSPADPEGMYRLYLNSSPANAGRFSCEKMTYMKTAMKKNVTAYDNGDFIFKYWLQNGEVVADSARTITVTMAAEDLTYTAYYVYAPTDPKDPTETSERNDLALSLDVSKRVLEEGDEVTLTVKSNRIVVNNPLTIYLNAENYHRFTFPSQLVIPAGYTSVSTTVKVKNDDVPSLTIAPKFTASAAGHTQATTIVQVDDNDVPAITLSLTPTTLCEDAGPGAMMAVLKRTGVTNNRVTIRFSDDSNKSDIYYSHKQITLEKNVTEAQFTIGVNDNQQKEGDRDVNITAAVYINSCGCDAQSNSAGAVTKTIHITDNDGPSLKLSASQTMFNEGQSNAATLTVTRNTGTVGTTTVNISSDQDDALNYTHTVVIPNGAESASIVVAVPGNSTQEGDRTVTFTATADGFSQATTWGMITDKTLPDAQITSLTIDNWQIECGSQNIVNVTVKNGGSATLPVGQVINIYYGGSETSIATITTEKDIAAGEEVTISRAITMPIATGKYFLSAKINEQQTIKELTYLNNTSANVVISLTPSFTANVTVDKQNYVVGDSVMITGKATGSAAFNANVDIYYINAGVRNVIKSTTDANGNISATLPLEKYSIGHFTMGACFPDEEVSTTQTSFNVYGLKRSSNEALTIEAIVGEPKSGYISISNPCPTQQSGFDITLIDVPEGCEPTFTLPASIAGNATVKIPYVINATSMTKGKNWENFTFRITSSQGGSCDIKMYYFANVNRGVITPSVAYINTTMTKGKKREFAIGIVNTGKGETGEMTLSLPDVDWLKSLTPTTMGSLASGDTAEIKLQFSPTDNEQLNVRQTGNLAINIANGNGITIPYSITPVSESTGSIVIDVMDEYSFYTDEKPHLKGAKVKLGKPLTGEVVAEGTTGTNGTYTIANIPEGYYTLYVSADKHSSYQNNILVNPGMSDTTEVILNYRAVSIDWQVEETEVEDVYEITTVATFETNVPVPVVKSVWPNKIFHKNYMFNVYLTNVGLINAKNVYLKFPEDDEYKFEILDNIVTDVLSPQQTVVVPVRVTVEKEDSTCLSSTITVNGTKALYEATEMLKAKARGEKLPRRAEAKCGKVLEALVHYDYFCAKDIDMYDGNTYAEQLAACFKGGGKTTTESSPVPAAYSYSGTSSASASSGYSAVANIETDCNKTLNDLKTVRSLIKIGVNRAAMGYGSIVIDATNLHDQLQEAKTPAEVGRIYGDFARDVVTSLPGTDYLAAASDLTDIYVTQNSDLDNVITNVSYYGNKHISDITYIGVSKNGNVSSRFKDVHKSKALAFHNVGERTEQQIDSIINVYSKFLQKFPKKSRQYVHNLMLLTGYVMAEKALLNTLIGGGWDDVSLTDIQALNKWLAAYAKVDDNNQFIVDSALLAQKPANLSELDYMSYINRLNNFKTGNSINLDSVAYYRDLIEGFDDNAISEGYTSTIDAVNQTCADFYEHFSGKGSSGVCATVKIQIDQTVTMTRQAFRGTLTITNGNETDTLKNAVLTLVVTDPYDNVATSHEFQINYESIDGFEGNVDGPWNLGPDKTGVATILFIPTKYAAPTEPVRWSFGGQITYVDPNTGLEVTRELFPVTLTVKPSPILDFTYFMQRDLYGDDPMTLDVVEPVVPGEFSLLINNKGYGDATKVKISTEQPKIIENEKGLFIDFEILSSQLNGGNKVMALDSTVVTDIGTIPAKSSVYAQWALASTLLGHFVDMSVKATHVTSYDNPDLSLLDNVTIHKLIRSVEANGQTAFLVSDENMEDLPDSLYTLDGARHPVAIADNMEWRKQDDTTYIATITTGTTGQWNYVNSIDPTNGRSAITRIMRQDGTAIGLRNAWQTDRTLIDGSDWVYEKRIHLCDSIATTRASYTVNFTKQADVVLAVESYDGLADKPIQTSAVPSINVTFNKAVDASTFSGEDITLTCQGVRLNTSSIVPIQIDEKTFSIPLTGLTNGDGYYVLTVQTAGITDNEGFSGANGKQLTWNQYVDSKCTITTMVSPADAAVVSPATAVYPYGSSNNVLTTVIKDNGYEWDGWYLHGEKISSDMQYAHTITGSDTLIATYKPRQFTVKIDADDGGDVNIGTGSYEYKDTLDLVSAAKAGYNFIGWYSSSTASQAKALAKPQKVRRANVPSNYLLLSTALTLHYGVNGTDSVHALFEKGAEAAHLTQDIDLNAQWNWVSFGVETSVLSNASSLMRTLGTMFGEMQSQEGYYLERRQAGIIGSLQNLSLTKAYKVAMNNATTLELNGTEPGAVKISLDRGDNWLGYPLATSLSLNDALKDLTATTGDVIQSQNSFAVYDGSKWVGSLQSMQPGKGYIYTSVNNTEFVYGSGLEANVSEIETAYEFNANKYPDTHNFIATLVDKNGSAQSAADYSVGVFAGNECRGASVVVGEKLFITVHGTKDSADVLTFKLMANPAKTEQTSTTIATFSSGVSGSLSNPFKIVVPVLTGVNEISEDDFSVQVINNRLVIQSGKAFTTNLYTISGAAYRTLKVEVGTNIYDIAQPGIYAISGKKVIIK